NHQFLHLVFYSFYQIFGIHGFPWYLFFCTLHALNGFLLYKFVLDFNQHWKTSIPEVMAVIGSVLFLIHPYNVEAVVWKVCVHYLISMMAVLLICISFFRYMHGGDRKNLLTGIIVYAVSLFTLEISFIMPLVISFAGILVWALRDDRRNTFKKGIKYAGLMWALLGSYLVLNKFTLGSVVGHYGGKIHFQFDLLGIVSTEAKFLVKHLFFARFYSFKTKALLFDQILSLPEIAFFFMTLVISIVLVYFIRIRKWKPNIHVMFFGLITALLFILPVANIYFFHLQIGMNDRYSYFPMAFLIIAMVALFSKAPKWMSYGFFGIMIIISLFLQQKTLKYWNQSTDVMQALKSTFRWHDAPYVFILNSPDNLNGIVMASIINEPSGMDEIFDYQTPKPYDGKMFDVFQYNMTTPNDGVHVEQTGPMQIKVILNQWGNWWHRNGIGGSSYENEFYKVETLDFPYLLTFKQLPEGSVIIYQDGLEWKEFKFQENL
ncbi:MAG: hypothetical protein ABIQ11_02945, partial [Saprospiraceae bacterium]